jgi:alpha-galactosidase
MNIKLEIGKELKRMLDSKKDISEIATWADRKYAAHCREIDEKLDKILFALSSLSLSEEFILPEKELYKMAADLISEGETEDLSVPDSNSQKAIKIDDSWLMCPICQDAWQQNGVYRMVRCPKCNNKLYNPTFDEKK